MPVTASAQQKPQDPGTLLVGPTERGKTDVLWACQQGRVINSPGSAAFGSGAEILFAPYERADIPNGQGSGPAPRGTVSADFNRDGHPDIATISDFTYGDMLFVPNNGDATFGTPSRIAGTTGVQGIDAGDVNGDGHPDIVGMTDNEVRVKLGDGQGGFSSGGTHPLTLGGRVEPRVMDWTTTATSTSWRLRSPRSRPWSTTALAGSRPARRRRSPARERFRRSPPPLSTATAGRTCSP